MTSAAMEEFDHMKDAKYRLYMSAVDKALKSFENYQDWPDLIHSLTKLNKVIRDNQRFPVIPRRIIISKRLAQCMHKTWPAGVHLKALEVYDTIFKCMGTNRLSHELFIYSAGLFPLLEHSMISVKSPLLTMYETHFVPLGPRLLPGLSGFLSGVLPGLEEGSDYFDRTNSLLEKVCEGVGSSEFYGCIWQCVAGNSAVRLPAVMFVLSHINKSISIDDQQHVMGTSIETMIKALCAGVQDSNALVQRTTLDLLLVAFPLHNVQLVPSDVIRLVTASLSAILRRDMSLNRRLYSWLLGSEVDLTKLQNEHPFSRTLEEQPDIPRSNIYFDMYSRKYLIEGVKGILREMSGDIRPYRLLPSLVDRPEVGPVILDDFLFDVFRGLYFTLKSEDPRGSPKRKQDITKSANVFFNSLESWYIWQYLGSLFDQALRTAASKITPPVNSVQVIGGDIPDIWEVCEMSEFLLDVIPVEVSSNSPGEPLMNLLLRLVALLNKYIDSMTSKQLALSLRVCRALIKKLLANRISKITDSNREKDGDEGTVVRPSTVRSWIGKEKPANDALSANSSDQEIEVRNKTSELTQSFKTFIKEFQTFFISLVSGGRIINNQCTPQAFEKLKKTSTSRNDKYMEELRKFLTTVITERSAQLANLKLEHEDLIYLDFDLIVGGNEVWSECFDLVCEILVDTSSFPSLIEKKSVESVNLPPWAKTLAVCCCYLDRTPNLQLTAIGTLLDLAKLSCCPIDDELLVHATPLFDVSQILYIQKSTNMVKIITELLWLHLGNLSPSMQVRCIELLHQLLNTFTMDNAVERILSEILLDGSEISRVSSLHKFIKLWTVGRELQDGRQKRCFQPCLLKVLDNMLLPNNSPLRLQTEEWLCQALMRGDIARLLDPLLVILLDPASARLGILHVSIEPSAVEALPEEAETDDVSKIYAISSVEGNVIYHVSDSSRSAKGLFKKRLKWRWKNDTYPDQRVFAVTSLKGSPDSQLRYITEKNVSRIIEVPRTISGAVSLIINPMTAREDDENISESGAMNDARRFKSTTHTVDEDLKLSRVPVPASESPSESESTKHKFAEQLTEDSLSANEFFGGHGDIEDDIGRISREILDSVIDEVVKKHDNNVVNVGVGVHPLHSHLLLYCGVYDSTRTLYAFNALRNILSTNPRLFLCCSASSGTVNATYPSDLLVLLARHRKSVYGRSFDGPVSSVNEYIPAFRSSMYLEVLVSMCLNYARSYYPNLGYKLTADVLAGNSLVQLTSIETLTRVLTELIPLVRDSGKGFASYISTILTKCKIQKNILHCIMSSLNTIRHQLQLYQTQSGGRTFTEEIIDFNDTPEQSALTEHSRAMQVELLKLLLALIKLEYDVDSCKADPADTSSPGAAAETTTGSTLAASYSPGYLIPQQPLFFRAIASALSLKGSMCALHNNWTQLVTSSLPYLGAALPQIVMTVINQLCVNIEELAHTYKKNNSCDEELPADYAVTQLEALTVLCHYCVLDASEQVSPLGLASTGAGTATTSANTHIFTNLVHVFTPLPLVQIRRLAIKLGNWRVMSFLQKFPSLNAMLFGNEVDLPRDRGHLERMRGEIVLKRLPRMISSLSELWTAVTISSTNYEITLWGCPKVVRNQILEFLSPLSVHHGSYFLAAMAVVWHEKRDKTTRQVLPVPTAEQKVLVNLLASIKVLPIDTFVQTINCIRKQPPAVEASLQEMCLDVCVLELFYVYMQTTNTAQLAECWPSLLALLRDSLLLQPTGLFLTLAILNEFVQRSPAFQEKKDQRDLQDITAKLIEGCAAVAGTCLEQTTWLKRNLAVRDLDTTFDESSTLLLQSMQAQHVLAQILAPLLDVSYGSQEKEKVATLLISVMYNVTPYLKNHQARYSGSFLACSQLLASISGYPYTRKAWKKDAFDLLLDSTLFQMEEQCLTHWTTIIDNLMTHDQTTFNDLMGCIPAAPSGSYSLFSSRDQEYEQRAQMLKRLAFVIMCSDKDQYCKSIISIQDRLSESLRLPHVVPSIQAHVFFCFRVLLLRMSSDHGDALWSLIISEMVQVFTHIEQELDKESDKFNSHIRVMSALDSSWVVNSSNGLNAHGHPHYLLLTLAAAKLLDLAVLLPAHMLPQFQMYRWAFVGDPHSGRKQEHEFIPHVKRICQLMDDKYGPCQMYVRAKEGHLLLTETSIDSLQQLHPFFSALQSRPKCTTVDVEALERNILRDFLDKLPTSPGHN